MSAARKRRLEPLPKTESIKLTSACLAGLKANLDRCALSCLRFQATCVYAERLTSGLSRCGTRTRLTPARHAPTMCAPRYTSLHSDEAMYLNGNPVKRPCRHSGAAPQR